MKINRRGFTIPELLGVVFILFLLATSGVFVYEHNHRVIKTNQSTASQGASTTVSGEGHDFSVSLTFRGNVTVKNSYLEGKKDNDGVPIGHLDLVTFHGNDSHNLPVVFSVDRVDKTVLKAALECKGVIGSVNNVHYAVQTTTYLVATIMGQSVPFCGQNKLYLDNYIIIGSTVYSISVNRSDGTTKDIDLLYAQSVLNSIIISSKN